MLFNQSSVFDRLETTCELDIATGNITPKPKVEKGVDVMKVKMNKTVPGSINGIKVEEFNKGEVYDLPLFLAQSFISKGNAEAVEGITYETKVVEPETKDDLDSLGRKELFELAKKAGIKGYSRMKNEEIIEELRK